MTIADEAELLKLTTIGRIVADTLAAMGQALEPGMTTKELDDLGRAWLEGKGARPAPELLYGFPGATCISINPVVAHGIPDDRGLCAGDLVNIDVSAEKDGFFADSGASFVVPPSCAAKAALCRTARHARDRAIGAARAGRPLRLIGQAIEAAARAGGYSVIQNLHGHGVGASLHEAPHSVPPYDDPSDRRLLHAGLVLTVEPFLSTGALRAETGDDGWSLLTPADFMTAQYEHTIVVTRNDAIIVT